LSGFEMNLRRKNKTNLNLNQIQDGSHMKGVHDISALIHPPLPSPKITTLYLDFSFDKFINVFSVIQVAQSNKQCLSQGGSYCLLNYEAARQQRIRVRSTDDGVPSLFYDTDFVIYIRDVNDQPRDLKLSNNRVKENATINSLIGQFSARDEDAGQSKSYSLSDDDSGRFRVDTSGALYKAKTTNYETQKKHTIRAVVTDNGSPATKVCK
jgi:hypothetical protein